MSYVAQSDPHILSDVSSRKEYVKYSEIESPPEYHLGKFALERLEESNVHVELATYQSLVGNFINPRTPYGRLLLKWDPGMGKTIAAIDIAMQFNYLFERESQIEGTETGSVFVIGFTQEIFKKELLSYPQYGYVTREDINHLNHLRELAQSESQIDIENLQEFQNNMRRRLVRRRANGYFRFYGYKEFVGRIFMLKDGDRRRDLNEMDESEIRKALQEGSIKWNRELLDSFKNSLLICDEIHNVYNSDMKNNWGIALQSVLDWHPTLKALFMSATPINNNPSEVVDLLNLLLPAKQRLQRNDLFADKSLRLGALDKVAELSRGYVSFVQDIDPKQFASQTFAGERIPKIDYLKFVRCTMSPLHARTYRECYSGTLAQDEQYLNDFALPNPSDAKGVGLFKSLDIKRALTQVPDAYYKKYGFRYTDGTITGHGLLEQNLGQYSAKMLELLILLKSLLKPRTGKVFVYHNVVNISGVRFIEQILLANGFLSVDQAETNDTLCTVCGVRKRDHPAGSTTPDVYADPVVKLIKSKPRKKVRGGYDYTDSDTEQYEYTSGELVDGGAIDRHPFVPARFIMVHSEMDEVSIRRNTQNFNTPDNTMGDKIKILIGSKKTRESIDLKAIRHVFVVGRPDNIPTLIQILGRARRKRGHDLLPPELRTITVYILTSCLPGKQLSHEEERYGEKIEDYKIIQLLERTLHENAIDGYLFHTLTHRGMKKDHQGLGNLWFKPRQPPSKSPAHLIRSTFDVFHAREEINTIMYIIKRLFIEVSYAFDYQNLWQLVRKPPFTVEVRTDLLDEDNFVIALDMLLFVEEGYIRPTTIDSQRDKREMYVRDLMWNDLDRRIMQPDRMIGYIHYIGSYYIFVPFVDGSHMIHTEAPFRSFNIHRNESINITRYLKDTMQNIDYGSLQLQFHQYYKDMPIEKLIGSMSKYSPAFHQQFTEETIKYVFNMWTNPSTGKNELHEFYFKMLYCYSMMGGRIAWASSIKPLMVEVYKPYVLPIKTVDIQRRNSLAVASSSTMSSSNHQIESIQIVKQEYKRTLALSEDEFRTRSSKQRGKKIVKSEIVKVDPIVLPVGHFWGQIPRFYTPEKDWYEVPEYTQTSQDYVENDIIIGYEERSETDMYFKIKLRKPIQFIEKQKDTRKTEKGSICTSIPKETLQKYATDLGIKIPEKINVPTLCGEIHMQLVIRENNERSKGTNIKWFYFVYESRPEATGRYASSSSSSSHLVQ